MQISKLLFPLIPAILLLLLVGLLPKQHYHYEVPVALNIGLQSTVTVCGDTAIVGVYGHKPITKRIRNQMKLAAKIDSLRY